MAETKNQKIAVYLTDNTDYKTLIIWGIKISAIFKKELCLVCLAQKEKEREKLNQKLGQYMLTVNKEIPGLPISTLVLNSKSKHAPLILADNYEVILIITPSLEFRKFSSGFSSSPIPFLFVNDRFTKTNDLKKVIIPVDLRRANNDSGLWGSYFGRFNHSKIILIAANDNTNEYIRLVKQNVAFIEVLFRKFTVNYHVVRGKSGSFKIQDEALMLAKESDMDLMIATGSSTISIIDLIIGLPEKRLIDKAGALPVLLINPRQDMYILCE